MTSMKRVFACCLGLAGLLACSDSGIDHLDSACRRLDRYCETGDYVWVDYGLSEVTLCKAAFSCAADFFDADCREELQEAVDCLHEVEDPEDCRRCQDEFIDLSDNCPYPAPCFDVKGLNDIPF